MNANPLRFQQFHIFTETIIFHFNKISGKVYMIPLVHHHTTSISINYAHLEYYTQKDELCY